MRTAVISNPRKAEVRNIDVAKPGARELRIRLQGCGVCGSNVPVWEGRPWFQYPLEAGAPGHEGWGVVDEVGTEVAEFRCGDRVALLSYHAYADYDLASAEQVLHLPEQLGLTPFPAEPLGCAMNIFARSEIHEGSHVAILGIGFMGALLVQLAKAAGAQVAAISRRPFALETAHSCGANETFSVAQSGVRDAALGVTGHKGFDCVIEAVGRQESLDLAGELVRERGRLVIAGYHQDGLRQVNMQMWNWKGIDVVNAHERDPRTYIEGMRSAIDAVIDGRINPEPLYTHVYPLEDLPRALDMASTRPDGFLKALVVS